MDACVSGLVVITQKPPAAPVEATAMVRHIIDVSVGRLQGLGPRELSSGQQQDLVLPRILVPNSRGEGSPLVAPVAVIGPGRAIERIDPSLEGLPHHCLPTRVMVAEVTEDKALQHARRGPVPAENPPG